MTRVLIIDDQQNFRHQLRCLLEQGGLEVIAEADDITSAEMFLWEEQPDLAVVDVLLGDASGIEGTLRLKNIAPKMRGILVSAYRNNHLETFAKAVGAEVFIPKDKLNFSMIRTWSNKEKK